MKKIDEYTKMQVRNALKSGMVGLDVASRTGVSTATVTKIRKEMEREGFDIWHTAGKVSKYIK